MKLSEAGISLRPQLLGVIHDLPPEGKEYVEVSEEMEDLAEKYLQAGIVEEQFRRDALHIAIATVAQVDVLSSWNFKHIVNLKN
jgi:hypothetical protein